MDSRQSRIYDRIQPGLSSMGVADQAAMHAAGILADAEEVAVGKVDVAQKALTMAQTNLDAVRALIRAAAGEGATRRTSDALLAQHKLASDARTRVNPDPKQCPKTDIHARHTWSLGASMRSWECAGVTSARCETPMVECKESGGHGSHDTEAGHCHGRIRGRDPESHDRVTT